jgi:hypothetical protein
LGNFGLVLADRSDAIAAQRSARSSTEQGVRQVRQPPQPDRVIDLAKGGGTVQRLKVWHVPGPNRRWTRKWARDYRVGVTIRPLAFDR